MNVSQTSLSMPNLSSTDLELSSKEFELLRSKVDKSLENANKGRINDVASEFESVFLSMMLKEMRATVETSEGGLFGGEGSDTYGGMFDMFMGQHLAKAQPLGIADAIKGYLGNVPG